MCDGPGNALIKLSKTIVLDPLLLYYSKETRIKYFPRDSALYIFLAGLSSLFSEFFKNLFFRTNI